MNTSAKAPSSLYTAWRGAWVVIALTQVLQRLLGPVLEATFFGPESNIRMKTAKFMTATIALPYLLGSTWEY